MTTPWTPADEAAYIAATTNGSSAPATAPEPECLADWYKASKDREAIAAEAARTQRLGSRYRKMQQVLAAHKERHGEIPIEIYIAAQTFMVMCDLLAEQKDTNAILNAAYWPVEEEKTA